MRVIVSVLGCLVLVACGNARWSSIARPHAFADTSVGNGANGIKSTVVGGKSIIVDAKQRAIIAHFYKEYDDDEGTVAVCAEPSPDAVAALSTAFAGSLGGGLLGTTDKDVAISTSFSETVKKLGKRNATIQLLRDALYRQCEAYANGAIQRSEYASASRRYIDAMVVLLAIEQLTNGPESPDLLDSPKSDKEPIKKNAPIGPRIDRAKNPNGAAPGVTKQSNSGNNELRDGAGNDNARAQSGANEENSNNATVPNGNNVEGVAMGDRIAIEVRTMVEAFFRRGIVSECLALLERAPDFYRVTVGLDEDVKTEYFKLFDERLKTHSECTRIISAVADTAETQASQAEKMSRFPVEVPLDIQRQFLQRPPLY